MARWEALKLGTVPLLGQTLAKRFRCEICHNEGVWNMFWGTSWGVSYTF